MASETQSELFAAMRRVAGAGSRLELSAGECEVLLAFADDAANNLIALDVERNRTRFMEQALQRQHNQCLRLADRLRQYEPGAGMYLNGTLATRQEGAE
jgi:Holliday junction resolvase